MCNKISVVPTCLSTTISSSQTVENTKSSFLLSSMSLITMGGLVIASSLLAGVGVGGATGEIVGETAVREAVGFLIGEIVVGQIIGHTASFAVRPAVVSLIKPAVGLSLELL